MARLRAVRGWGDVGNRVIDDSSGHRHRKVRGKTKEVLRRRPCEGDGGDRGLAKEIEASHLLGSYRLTPPRSPPLPPPPSSRAPPPPPTNNALRR